MKKSEGQYCRTFQTDLKTSLNFNCYNFLILLKQKLKFKTHDVVNMHVSTQEKTKGSRQSWEWQRHKLDF